MCPILLAHVERGTLVLLIGERDRLILLRDAMEVGDEPSTPERYAEVMASIREVDDAISRVPISERAQAVRVVSDPADVLLFG